MKTETKISPIRIIIPALLIFGIIICAIIYRSDTVNLVTSEKDRSLFESASEQTYLFVSQINERYDILKEYSEQLRDTDSDNRLRILGKIKTSAAKYGFSDIAAVGDDVGLQAQSERPDVTGQTYFKTAQNGGSALEKITGSGGTFFAFAVPFLSEGTNEGAVVGFCPEESMQKMLASCDMSGLDAPLIFDSAGNIIIGTNKLPQFTGQSNVFRALEGTADKKTGGSAADAVRLAVAAGEKNFVNSSFGGTEYDYAFMPLGINGWYLLHLADLSDIDRQNMRSLLLLAVAVLLSLLLFIVLMETTRKRRIEKREDRVRLDEAISIDHLTGLFNKPGFEAETRKRLDTLPEDCVCAVVSFEVVSFRSYNALYGFDAGDALLRKIADIIREICIDAAGRLYADHFVMFVSGRDNEDVFTILKKGVAIAKDSGLPFYLCGGIDLVDRREMPVPLMVDRASIAKDTIKYKFGTGIAIYSDSMLECQIEDAELVGSMMKSLKNGEFVAYYQPKYKMDTETIAGAEALVRWQKPDGEIIKPGKFIELFEKNGFIRRLDFNVFEQACIMLRETLDAGRPVVPISVNFSRVHLYDSHFPQRIYNIARKHNIDMKYLEIELTETAFLMEGKELSKVVGRLHDFGFTVAIDDFGSGFSSLNMLKDVPVDVLKIDMKFLEGFENGGKVGTVVTSIIRMAKWLGIPVVAEGVETKSQVDFLRTLGCNMVQGFFYSHPLAREDYEKLLNNEPVAVYERPEKPPVFSQESINAIMGGDSLVNTLVDGIFGAFGLYELSQNRLEAIRVNKSYCEILGYPDMSAFSGHSLNILMNIYSFDVEMLLDVCVRSVRTGNVQKFTVRRYDYYGNLRQFSGLIKHVGGSAERPLLCITFIDATERLQADRERELSKYGDALTGIFDEIWEFDYTQNTVCRLSSNHVRGHGRIMKLDEVEKKWIENKIFPEDRGTVEKIRDSARADKLEMPSTLEYREYVNGEIRWISSSMVTVAGGSYLLCNLDITDKKQFELLVEKIENLHRRVELDAASGVLNSNTVENLVKERLKRDAPEKLSALMTVSLDNYKNIGAMFGETVAHALIKDAASRIKSMFREQDIVGRISEEKFIVYMSGISDFADAGAKAQNLRGAIESMTVVGNFPVSCSVGVSIITADERDYVQNLVKAETALRESRRKEENPGGAGTEKTE